MPGYEAAWAALNARLRSVEADGGGLPGALAGLEHHQRESGFIRDDLHQVMRFTFREAGSRSHSFRVQFNPRRRLRFKGAGRPLAPGVDLVNGGCFLCKENIRWLQEEAEFGYRVDVGGAVFLAWMNPFPLLPNHVVIAAGEHVPQEWSVTRKDGTDIARIIADLADLALRMPEHVGFYNGVAAGASIPGHLHYQFCHRPAEDPVFPLESWVAAQMPAASTFAVIEDYPVPVVCWRGAPAEVVPSAVGWLAHWAARNRDRRETISANIIAAAEVPGTIAVYFVPRDRARSRWGGSDGAAGGLEILGEFVFSTEAEAELLAGGGVDYAYLREALRRVRTPLFAA